MTAWFDAGAGQLPTESVGSLPRPVALQQAVLDAEAGLTDAALIDALADAAVTESVQQQLAAGATLVTDGEQRRQSFATYWLDEADVSATALQPRDQPVFAVFADGHHRVLPQLRRGPLVFRQQAAAGVTAARRVLESEGSDARVKQAVVSPAMVSLMYPSDGLPDYPRDQFLADVVDQCSRDIRGCFAAGAERVSIDFTEGRLALRTDLRAPWAGPRALHGFITLMNRVLDRLPDDERARVGVHTCPGNDRDSAHSADVDYAALIPELLQIEAGYFLVQAAGEKDSDRVARLVGQHLPNLASGRRPRVLLGVTRPTTPRLETETEIRQQLVRAARFIPPEQLGSTDDCGFSPYLIDEKPRHGSPDFARQVAFAKIAARVRGTQAAAAELSGGAI